MDIIPILVAIIVIGFCSLDEWRINRLKKTIEEQNAQIESYKQHIARSAKAAHTRDDRIVWASEKSAAEAHKWLREEALRVYTHRYEATVDEN